MSSAPPLPHSCSLTQWGEGGGKWKFGFAVKGSMAGKRRERERESDKGRGEEAVKAFCDLVGW